MHSSPLKIRACRPAFSDFTGRRPESIQSRLPPAGAARLPHSSSGTTASGADLAASGAPTADGARIIRVFLRMPWCYGGKKKLWRYGTKTAGRGSGRSDAAAAAVSGAAATRLTRRAAPKHRPRPSRRELSFHLSDLFEQRASATVLVPYACDEPPCVLRMPRNACHLFDRLAGKRVLFPL